jgi:1D-myo-inositol 3-kinase
LNPNFVTIGHITKDLLPEGGFVPGGTVTFASITARNLGQRAAIITAAPHELRQLPLYNDIDIRGPETEVATIFENIYQPWGREQFVRAVAPVIREADVPEEWRGPAGGIEIVHLAPVAQECDPGLVELFPGALIGLTPQGFMREWHSATGQVQPIDWAGAKALLPRLSALVLSTEDLPKGPHGQEVLQEFIALCPIVALTQGPRGCTIFQGGEANRVPAYPAQEIDPTGAGDVFATAYLLYLRKTGDPLDSARFANAAAACNIEKPGATGVPTIPEVEARLRLTPLA